MTTRIAFGIPHRVGACFCEVGKGRSDPDVEQATELTDDWEDIVANKPIEPGHKIITLDYEDKVTEDGKNDGVTSLVASLKCWSNYSNLQTEPDPEDPEKPVDPKLIVKAKGDVAAGEAGSFPSIQITLRPLKTELNYSYTGNANASGEGEIGFESQDPTADALALNYWQGGAIGHTFFTDEENYNGINSYVTNTGFDENQAAFEAYIAELHPLPVTYTKTTFYREEDRPAEDQTPFEPLTGLEIDPTFLPRLPSSEAYDFSRNESFDYRYRFPANYFQKYGTLSMPIGFPIGYPNLTDDKGNPVINNRGSTPGSWVWTLHQPNQSSPLPLNPLFEPDPSKDYLPFPFTVRIDEGVAPVIKGWYWDSNTPPSTSNGYGGIFQSTAFKMTKEIRKRYPYSFLAKQTRTESLRVYDHTPGNQICFGQWEYEGGDYTNPTQFFGFAAAPASYTSELFNKQSSFEAQAWWRMEVTADLCEWNSKKTPGIDPVTGLPKVNIAGATIKGVIKLGIKRLFPSVSAYGLYSKQGANSFDESKNFVGVTPSFVFKCQAELYFDEYFNYKYQVLEYDGGEIPWQVTLDEDNAKGEPIKFLDFPITSEAELPGQQPGDPGSVPENSLVFIKDFIVTEVILP
jgi:hypothetical protein